LLTTLEWIDTDVSDDTERSGLGLFTITDFVKRFPSHPLGEGYDYIYDAYGYFNVAAMSLAVRTSSVSEPTVAVLIVTGIVGIGYRSRRRITAM
jgi:hypothetical protein